MKETIHEYLNTKVPSFMINEKKNNYSFKILKPCNSKGEFNKIEKCKNSIFLAGPCPRKDYSDDWRFEAYDLLEKIGFTGTVLTPTNENYQKIVGTDALGQQTWWEHTAMSTATAIVFWIPRSKEHPARTTNIEFGEWFKKPNTFFGWPKNAEHNEYLAVRLKENGKKYESTLYKTLKNAVDATKRKGTMYFTSDTHFSQERTLNYSRRPFVNVDEMDLEMISNWNKNVTMQDTVVHCGDFGELENIKTIIGNLNFKKLIWVCGNYERREYDKYKKLAKGLENVEFVDYYTFTENKKNYLCVHEPINPYVVEADKKFGKDKYITLFGHIHGRNFAKTNGFDLGIDYHRYAPISLEQVEWFRNAMQYWDINVHTGAVMQEPSK